MYQDHQTCLNNFLSQYRLLQFYIFPDNQTKTETTFLKLNDEFAFLRKHIREYNYCLVI